MSLASCPTAYSSTFVALPTPSARRTSRLALDVGFFIIGGIGNVVLQMPMLLREAHAANAVVSFLAYVIAAFFAALDPVASRVTQTGGGVRAASGIMASSK